MNIEMKTGDWLILILCLLLIPLSWTLTRHQPGETNAIEITVGNESPATFSIKENHQVNVAGELGDSVIEIRDGKVRFASSPCSGKVCILSGWHQHSGDHIVCLPNKVGVSLLSQQDRFDGINF
jgi:hypothetical protein